LVSFSRESPSPITSIKLRRFGIFEFKKIRDWLKPYEMAQKAQEKEEMLRIEKKNQELLKIEEERRKIFQVYLLGGSNFLRDFHTNLF